MQFVHFFKRTQFSFRPQYPTQPYQFMLHLFLVSWNFETTSINSIKVLYEQDACAILLTLLCARLLYSLCHADII